MEAQGLQGAGGLGCALAEPGLRKADGECSAASVHVRASVTGGASSAPAQEAATAEPGQRKAGGGSPGGAGGLAPRGDAPAWSALRLQNSLGALPSGDESGDEDEDELQWRHPDALVSASFARAAAEAITVKEKELQARRKAATKARKDAKAAADARAEARAKEAQDAAELRRAVAAAKARDARAQEDGANVAELALGTEDVMQQLPEGAKGTAAGSAKAVQKKEEVEELRLMFRTRFVKIFGSVATGLCQVGEDFTTGRISRRHFEDYSVNLGALSPSEAARLFSHVAGSRAADFATHRDFGISDEEWGRVAEMHKGDDESD